MQSGISASPELHDAFKTFLRTDTSLALLITIASERLIPVKTLESDSTPFPASISLVNASIAANEAAYIILRTPQGLAAVTYVPDTAPVRSKMLFASTRLTLTRELGTEHFSESVFMTNKDDVSGAGWRAHERSREAEKPLTSAEAEMKMLREADEASAGTAARRVQFGMAAGAEGSSSGLALKVDDGLREALAGFREEAEGALLTVKFDIPSETLHLDTHSQSISAEDLAASISSSDPRYTFYKYNDVATTVFIYTCPSSSKIKERMIYAASRARFVSLVESDLGLTIAEKLEGGNPDEFSAQTLSQEFEDKAEVKSGFARPKRPGRR